MHKYAIYVCHLSWFQIQITDATNTVRNKNTKGLVFVDTFDIQLTRLINLKLNVDLSANDSNLFCR